MVPHGIPHWCRRRAGTTGRSFDPRFISSSSSSSALHVTPAFRKVAYDSVPDIPSVHGVSPNPWSEVRAEVRRKVRRIVERLYE